MGKTHRRARMAKVSKVGQAKLKKAQPEMVLCYLKDKGIFVYVALRK